MLYLPFCLFCWGKGSEYQLFVKTKSWEKDVILVEVYLYHSAVWVVQLPLSLWMGSTECHAFGWSVKKDGITHITISAEVCKKKKKGGFWPLLQQLLFTRFSSMCVFILFLFFCCLCEIENELSAEGGEWCLWLRCSVLHRCQGNRFFVCPLLFAHELKTAGRLCVEYVPNFFGGVYSLSFGRFMQ